MSVSDAARSHDSETRESRNADYDERISLHPLEFKAAVAVLLEVELDGERVDDSEDDDTKD